MWAMPRQCDSVRLLLIACPGAGKGTQAKKLAACYDVIQFSSGDVLRGEIHRERDLENLPMRTYGEGISCRTSWSWNCFLSGCFRTSLPADMSSTASPGLLARPRHWLNWLNHARPSSKP